MDNLIQTQKCSIIYGEFQGKENQELFRCPRELDNIDLINYIRKEKSLIGFEDDNTEDLHDVEGKSLVGYYRMYFRNGWYGKWMLGSSGIKPDIEDCALVDKIIVWLQQTFTRGCSYDMIEYFEKNYSNWGENRYLVRPKYIDNCKIMVDTEYGNGDYPVRIYIYNNKEK